MFSIIIPIHNLGYKSNYCLNKCLDSITAQLYNDFEVLLMENGSTDDTVEVAQQYCNKDNRFKLYELNSLGVSNARNAGIDKAHGEYIIFIDGDDFISNDFLQSSYNILCENDIDIVFLPWSFYYSHSNKTKQVLNFTDTLICHTENHIPINILSFICAKFIKTSIIKNKLFFNTNFSLAEDTLFMIEAYLLSQTIAYSSSGTYYYVQNRRGQATKDFSIDKLNSLFNLPIECANLFKTYGVLEDNIDIVNNLYISFFIGNKFAQTPLTKASVKNIKSFINLNRNNILNININNIKCNNWQKKWFNRLIFFIKNNKGHIFLKFMRFYRNILPKFILKKLYA